MLFSIGAFSGDVQISYKFVVIYSVPVLDSNNLWYISYCRITISCEIFDDESENGLVSPFMSSSSKFNQVQISSIF